MWCKYLVPHIFLCIRIIIVSKHHPPLGYPYIHFADLLCLFVIYIIKNFKGGYLTGENYFLLESF
jgi:hypothetical protein